jgi:hypothetical protein
LCSPDPSADENILTNDCFGDSWLALDCPQQRWGNGPKRQRDRANQTFFCSSPSLARDNLGNACAGCDALIEPTTSAGSPGPIVFRSRESARFLESTGWSFYPFREPVVAGGHTARAVPADAGYYASLAPISESSLISLGSQWPVDISARGINQDYPHYNLNNAGRYILTWTSPHRKGRVSTPPPAALW